MQTKVPEAKAAFNCTFFSPPEKQDFDGKNYRVVSQYKDRHWHQNKHYCEDSHSYIYPYGDKGSHPMYPYFFKNYERCPPYNLTFHHRGGFYPRRRGFYIPHWQKYSRAGRGSYRNFQAQDFPSDSCYYENMTNDYYRYFQKLAKGSKEQESSDTPSQNSCSASHSCSKHSQSSQSKSRSLSRTRSHSKSRSQSRSCSHKRFRSRSASLSPKKSQSRTCSYSRSCSQTWTRSPSQSVTHSKCSDNVAEKSVVVKSVSRSKEERTTKHSDSKKKKRKHKRGDACSDSGKESVKHKR